MRSATQDKQKPPAGPGEGFLLFRKEFSCGAFRPSYSLSPIMTPEPLEYYNPNRISQIVS